MKKSIGIWLLVCAAMVFVMAIIGAVTRLTESGLSIAEWKPLAGALPPLNAAEWERVFGLYKETPQYQKVFAGMSLEEFKGIFWWEWVHRFWGRLIGLVFAVPMAWFWLRGHLTPGLKRGVLALLVLGGLQGAVGWFMVASGLVDRPSVSHYRLALHLGLALFLYAALLVMAFQVLGVERREASFCLRRHAWVGFALLCITIVWGAFTAGLDAGKIYNEWPLMSGKLIPGEVHALNFWSDAASVQFVHRWAAIFAAFALFTAAWRTRSYGWPAKGVMVMAVVQPLLGIETLLRGVPIATAAIHQAGAMVLLGFTAALLFRLRPALPRP